MILKHGSSQTKSIGLLAGVAVIALAAIFTLTGCDPDGGDDPAPNQQTPDGGDDGDGPDTGTPDPTAWTAILAGTGTSWTQGTDSVAGAITIRGIAYGGDKWVVGGSQGKMACSRDGITWETVTNSTFSTLSFYIYGIAYGGGKWVVVGASGRMAYSGAQE